MPRPARCDGPRGPLARATASASDRVPTRPRRRATACPRDRISTRPRDHATVGLRARRARGTSSPRRVTPTPQHRARPRRAASRPRARRRSRATSIPPRAMARPSVAPAATQGPARPPTAPRRAATPPAAAPLPNTHTTGDARPVEDGGGEPGRVGGGVGDDLVHDEPRGAQARHAGSFARAPRSQRTCRRRRGLDESPREVLRARRAHHVHVEPERCIAPRGRRSHRGGAVPTPATTARRSERAVRRRDHESYVPSTAACSAASAAGSGGGRRHGERDRAHPEARGDDPTAPARGGLLVATTATSGPSAGPRVTG